MVIPTGCQHLTICTTCIAGIDGTGQPLSASLDLSAFKKFRHRFMVAEGQDANMQVAVTPLTNANGWHHEIPARGGFILRLNE